MRMREVGLVDKWYQENSPDVPQCINNNFKKGPDPIKPLSIKHHLVDAFIILLFGYSAALFFFIVERVVTRLRQVQCEVLLFLW